MAIISSLKTVSTVTNSGQTTASLNKLLKQSQVLKITTMENTILVPFVIGYGKTGTAKTGEKHAMIKETLHYTHPMNDYRACIMRNTQPQDDKDKVMSMANKYFLFDKLLDESKQVFEFSMPNGETLVFFNYNTLFPPYSVGVQLEINGNKLDIKR